MNDHLRTIVRTVVEPNGPGGCNGPPIEIGIGRVTRMPSDGGPPIVRHFDPPARDLLDADFAVMSDEEITRLGSALT